MYYNSQDVEFAVRDARTAFVNALEESLPHVPKQRDVKIYAVVDLSTVFDTAFKDAKDRGLLTSMAAVHEKIVAIVPKLEKEVKKIGLHKNYSKAQISGAITDSVAAATRAVDKSDQMAFRSSARSKPLYDDIHSPLLRSGSGAYLPLSIQPSLQGNVTEVEFSPGVTKPETPTPFVQIPSETPVAATPSVEATGMHAMHKTLREGIFKPKSDAGAHSEAVRDNRQGYKLALPHETVVRLTEGEPSLNIPEDRDESHRKRWTERINESAKRWTQGF